MRLLSYFLLLGCFTLLSSDLFAITFVGGFEGNIWTDNRNWSPQQVPGAGDEADVPSGKQANVNGDITVGTLILGGTLANNGDPNSKLTITTDFSLTGGSVNCPVYLLQGCASLWQGNSGIGANVFNHGEITVSGNTTVNYATIRNEDDGIINLSGGFKFQIINNPAVLANYGTLKRTGVGGTFEILLGGHTNYTGSETIVEDGELYASSLDNYAPITIFGGATFRTNGMSIYNGTSITGGGTFVSNGNGLNMNNSDLVTIDVSETELNSQGIKQTGPVTFTQHLLWKSGTLLAQVTFAVGSVVDINPGGGKGITNTTTNNGTINVNDSFGFSTGRLNNNGTMNLNGAYSNFINNASEGIHNYGTIKKPVGASGTYNMGVPLYNETGSHLLVQQDELFVNSNLYNAAEIIVNAGATLRAHTTESRNGATFSGPGTFIIQNNGLTAVNTAPISIDIAELVLNAKIGGTGAVSLTGHVNWTQGDLSAPVTFATGSVIDMNPGGNHGISGTTTNNGTFNINTSFTLSAGHIDNNGLMLLNGAHTIGIHFGTPGIFNHGTVKKTTGNSGVYTMGVPLTNYSDGQVIVEEGELRVNSDFKNAGSLSVAANAIFKANKTVVENGASFTGAGKLIIHSNGLIANNTTNVNVDIAETEWLSSLNGTGPITFTQHVSWQNANVSAAVTIASGATLDLSTNGAHGIGGASILTNNGTMNANVNFGGGTLNNNGTLNLASGLNFGGGTLNNAGTMTNNAGGNVTAGYFVFNTGTIVVTGGTFTFSYGLSNTGTIDVATNANARLENYHQDNTFENGSILSGAGTFTLEANCTVNGTVNVDIETFVLNPIYYGLNGTGTMTFNHSLDWQSGSVDITIVIPSGNTLNLTGTGYKTLNGTLTNNGTVNCDSDLNIGNNAMVDNNSTFNFTGDNYFGPTYGFVGQFNNTGTLNKTSAGTLVFGMFLNNPSGGTVSVQNGVMEVGKLDNAGSLSVSEDATLTIKNGNNLSGGTVSGIGTLRIQDNGWHLTSTLVINSLNLEISGNLSGEVGASLEIESSATWFGGDLAVPTNVAAGGTFNIPGGGYMTLSASLTNAGTVNCSVSMSSSANITNAGTLNLSDNFSGFFGSDSDTLHNTGIINANAIYYNYLYLNVVNEGTIDILTGVAYLNNGLQQNQTITIAQDAEMFLYGTCAFNAGSSVTGAGSITSEGELTLAENFSFSGGMFKITDGALFGPGDLSINSAMTWQYGDIETDVDIAAGATLVIGYDNGGGGGSKFMQPSNSGFTLYNTITNDGTTTQNTEYYMDGGTFVNNGTIDMDYAGIYDDNTGGGTFTNNGTWNVQNYFETDIHATNDGTLAGFGELYFDIELVNNGTVTPGNSIGQLKFSPSYTNGSELQIEIQSNDGPGYGHDFVETDGNIQLNGNLLVTETGSPLNASFVIMRCNGGAGCLTGTFATTSMPSDYTITYTGEEVILNKGVPAEINPADTSICGGNPVTLTASVGDAYQWSTGETSQSIEVSPYNTTDYQVTVTTGSGGAVGAATVNVNPAPYEYVYPSYTYLCEGESVTLTVYGDNGTYLWDNGETTQSITVSPTTTVTYYVTITGDNGCTTVTSAIVEGTTNQPLVPEITGVPDSACQSDPGFYLETYQSGVYGEWSGPGTYYGYYFEPIGLSGPQVLTFTPYAGQCAIAVTWTIEVANAIWYADADGDGYGDPLVSENTCTQPSGYVSDNTDCDDTNAAINPNATEICNDLDDDCDGLVDEGLQSTFYADADADGYGDVSNAVTACSAPAGFVSDNTDCNDANASVNPGAIEICNDLDDDCDGQVDEGLQSTYYADADGDGYGNEAAPQQACTQPTGYVLDHTDCNDNNAAVNPGAIEICNALDDNCDGFIDEGVQSTFYVDADNDGYGNNNGSVQACSAPAGYVSDNTDCDDTNAAVNPGAIEICNNLDDDCDGIVDEGVQTTFYADADGDGYGDASNSVQACSAPAGYVTDSNDCNDNNDQIHPGAIEICNDLDDDCDGLVDENLIVTWYADADGDGYGNPSVSQTSCTMPAGYVSDNTDCDDTRATVNPGAPEVCNGRDDDCDGETDEGVQSTFYQDADGDGYGNPDVTMQSCGPDEGFVANSNDCDDTNPAIHPGATEICDDLDNDCNGLVDNDDPGITGQPSWYADTDGDGYGDAEVTQLSCTQPQGFVSDNTDCDDTNAFVNPSATEVCNQLDDDCDGLVDEGVQSTFYADTDGDGFGNALISTQACTAPAGYVSDATDCNDSNDQIFPGATEICNGYDDDCDGLVDEGVGSVWYADADGDGYGNAANEQTACSQPAGYVSNSDDCDDQNASIYPGATEVCNNLDDNCDGQIDEGDICDGDGDGYTLAQGDCDDSNPAIHPNAAEICNNLDDDCDGLTDENIGAIWYADADGDGYGNPTESVQACAQPSGYVNDDNDCNDDNDQIHPGAPEICNNVDDDCDGLVDETNLNLTLTSGIILCNGGTTVLVATATGGTAPYQYSLDGGAFGSSNNFAAGAGNHYITVRDANGCEGVNTIDINEPSAILIDPIEVTNIACGGGNTGVVDISVSGGTPGYSYHWSNNRTTQDLVNVAANTYMVAVTDSRGCVATASATVNPKLKLTMSKTNTLCNGGNDGTATATATAGTPNYTYDWNTGANTPTITGLSVGTYTCTITDALGCTRSAQISVGQPSAIGISGAVTKVTCNGSPTGAIAITISHGVAPFTYAWSDGASTEDRNSLTAGSYTLSVTDVNGCTREKTFNVTQPAALTLSFNVSNVSCNGELDGEITANVGGGTKFPTSNLCNSERYCFSWSHGDNARTTSGIGADTYTVTVTDANGCSIVGTATVTEPTVLEITHVQVEPLPNGKFKVTVTASGGTPNYKYKRIPGGGFQGSNVFNNVPTGIYDILVRDKNICETSTTITVGSAGRPENPDERQGGNEDLLVVDLDNPVSAYPNPASERFQLQVQKEYSVANVMIFNAQGQLTEERNFEDNANLGSYEVNTWKSGLYLVVVHLDGERFVQKVMVVSR